MKKFVSHIFKGGGKIPGSETQVNKRNCNLEEIPQNLTKLKYRDLEELLLDENHIQELPYYLFDLVKLRVLSLNSNIIQELPGGRLLNMKNLVELNISSNQISEIPESIVELEQLKIFDCSSNPIEILPNGIIHLPNLTSLNLNHMLLESLPDGFGKLTNLKILYLRENLIQCLPQSFVYLKNMEVLDFGDNYLEHFPIQICSLQLLDELWLDSNQIEIIPPEVENLKNISFVDLSKNLLKFLPNEIRHFIKLSNLYLSDNLLTSLPDVIGDLSSLTIICIDKNKLMRLTSSIGCCSNLEEIMLVENALKELPKSIGNLSNLKCLNVDGNRLKCLPLEIGLLKNLSILSLRENELSRLPEELSSCSELHVLDVTGNILQFLPYSLTRLNLKGLWIAENQAKPMPCFQTEYDTGTGDAILTCFLLPQIKCQSLCESKVKSISISNYKEEACNRENNETIVQFQMSSQGDIEEYFERETTLVRQKTPHPKDLKAKAQKLFENKTNDIQQYQENNSLKDMYFIDGNVNEDINKDLAQNDKIDQVDDWGSYEGEPVSHIGNLCYDEPLSTKYLLSNESSVLSTGETFLKSIETLQLKNDECVNLSLKAEDSDISENFDVNGPLEISANEKSNKLDDIKVMSIDPLCISRKMNIIIELNEDKMGFSISGGLGSTPYRPNDDGIFFSKIVPGGPAAKAGLLECDKLLAINGSTCINLEHHQVVEKLKVASKTGGSLKICIQREENNSSYQKDKITEEADNTDSVEKHSTALNISIGETHVTLNYLSPISYMANRPSYLRRNGPRKYT